MVPLGFLLALALTRGRPFDGFGRSGPSGAPYSYLAEVRRYADPPAAIRFAAPSCRLDVSLLDAEACRAGVSGTAGSVGEPSAVETFLATGPANPP